MGVRMNQRFLTAVQWRSEGWGTFHIRSRYLRHSEASPANAEGGEAQESGVDAWPQRGRAAI